MPVIPVNRVVDKKRIIGKREGRVGGDQKIKIKMNRIKVSWISEPGWLEPGRPD
jgi:hypothetical protein